jgi:glycosyltransferase involved in cell wall biosynthesis
LGKTLLRRNSHYCLFRQKPKPSCKHRRRARFPPNILHLVEPTHRLVRRFSSSKLHQRARFRTDISVHLRSQRHLVEVEQPKIILTDAAAPKTKPFVVVGIPAFDEENTIARVVMESQKFADAVVVCDDGSNDLTADIAERLGADVVQHEQNSGYGAAIRSLFERARQFGADILVTLDADGQHNPAEIPNVIKPIIAGEADVVIGSRFVEVDGTEEMPLYRRVGAKLITKMVNGSAKNSFSDAQSGFRAYNRDALEELSIVEAGMGASVEILLEASKHYLKIHEVPTTCKYENGDVATSTENPVTHGLSVMMSIVRLIVEERPLTVLGIPGLLCLFAGVFFGVWMLQLYAAIHVIVTNIALASLSFVLIGFFMISTSITLYAISRLSRKMNGKTGVT